MQYHQEHHPGPASLGNPAQKTFIYASTSTHMLLVGLHCQLEAVEASVKTRVECRL